jgi:type II secretory pathway component GspD/PulD (secretin)
MSARCRIVYLLSAVLLSASVGRAEETRLEQRVFAVSDLVVTLAPHEVGAMTTAEDRLIKLITDTIAPRSWSENGGRGTIDYHPLTMSLVINQTPAVQDQVADLLAAQRRLLDTEVSVEMKFVDVAEEVFQDLQRKGVLGKQDKKTHAHGNVTFLDDTEVLRLLDMVQDNVRSNVMQAPKLTTFSGQTAKINCIDKQFFVTGLEIVSRDDHIEYRPKTETVPLGVRAELRSVISADRRFVRVHLDTTLSNVASSETPQFPILTPAPDGKKGLVTHYIQRPRINKLNIKRTLTLPDGHTAVLTGFKGSVNECEVNNKYGPPILSDIPILRDLFCKVDHHWETRHLLVLVTPRIIIQKEEEEKQTGYVPSPAVVP